MRAQTCPLLTQFLNCLWFLHQCCTFWCKGLCSFSTNFPIAEKQTMQPVSLFWCTGSPWKQLDINALMVFRWQIQIPLSRKFLFHVFRKGQPTIFQPLANTILNYIYDIFWERYEGWTSADQKGINRPVIWITKLKFVIALECKHQHKMNELGCCLDRRRANRWGGGGGQLRTPGRCTVVPPACTVFQGTTRTPTVCPRIPEDLVRSIPSRFTTSNL